VPEECGLDITVVLDASGSIDDNKQPGAANNPGNSNRVRDAARAFLSALEDTGSRGRLVDFATGSRELVPMSLITSAGLLPGGAFDAGLKTYYARGSNDGVGIPANYVYKGGRRPPDPTQSDSYSSTGGNRHWTNWQEGLETSAGSGTQLVVFITDGDPTSVTSNRPGEPRYSASGTRIISNSGSFPNEFNEYALRKAMNVANDIKSTGARMLVVGVGSALNNQQSVNRLKDIAGPTGSQQEARVWDGTGPFRINEYGVTRVTDFTQLAEALRGVATNLCSPSLTITKLAQSADSAQPVPVPDWKMTVAPTVPGGSFTWTQPDRGSTDPSKTVLTDANGQSQFQWKPVSPNGDKTKSIARVTEDLKNGFTFNRADCRRLDDGIASNQDGFKDGSQTFAANNFDVTLGPDSIATCTLYNDFDYKPDFEVKKIAVDNPVRGDGPGWDERYNFEVKNTGNTPLDIVLTDPKCRPGTLSGPTGDADGDGKLDVTETWTYTCQARILAATSNQPIAEPNTVSVTATPPDPRTPPVTKTTTTTVDVKTPAMQITKTARRTVDGPTGPEIGPNDVIPAGTQVTYFYSLSNTGNDNIKEVATPTDDKCGPLTRTSGTGTVLNVGETWTYTCTQRLLPSSTESQVTNEVTTTGRWSGSCPDTQQPPCQNNGKITTKTTKTITVSRTATINVIKSIDPAPAPDQAFAFTAAARRADVTSFSLNPGATPATPSQVIRFEPIPGDNNAVITENGPPAGFQLTGIVCEDQNQNPVGSFDLGAGTATVPNINVGDNITCTYTNQPLPKVTVLKATSPQGATLRFDFTASRPAPVTPQPTPATFTLGDGDSQVFNRIPISGPANGPGREFTVAESTLPAGWGLNQIACGSKQITRTGNAATISLDYGDDVTCTFTNAELRPARITVAKSGPGGSTADFPFTVSGTGLVNPGQPGTDTFTLQVGGTRNISVRPSAAGDDYTVTEAPLPTVPAGQSGWTRTSIQCVKDSDPNNPISGTLGNGAVTVPGLLPGEHVTCTYVNERLPRLRISKQVQVAAGQSGANQTFGFTQTGLPGPASFGPLGNNDTEPFVSLTPGQAFTVTEDALPQDWRLTGLQCSGPGSTTVQTDQGTRVVSSSGLQPGDDVRCEYVNTKAPTRAATLTIVKQVEPAGSAPAFGFTLSGFQVPTADQSFTLSPDSDGDASRTVTVVPPDAGATYTLDEASLPAGWDYSQVKCQVNGSDVAGLGAGPNVQFPLEPGDSASCTYVNKPKARFTVVKKVSVADGQAGQGTQFAFTQTGLSNFGPLGNNDSRTFDNLTNGANISVTEAAVAGWSTTITCTGAGSAKYTVSAADARTVSPTGGVASGDDVTCTYTNTREPSAKAVLTVVKQVQPAAAGPEFDFTLGSAPNADPVAGPFTLQPNSTGTASRVFTLSPRDAAVGGTDYTVTEAAEAGWDLTQIECAGSNGQQLGNPNLGSGAVSVNLEPGDRATCTFTNKPKAKLTILKTVSVGTGQSGADRQFAFTQTGLSSFGPLGNNDRRTFPDLTAGTAVTVDETPVADWSAQVTCTGPGSAKYQPAGASVNVAATVESGDDVTCHYVNTKNPLRPALLTVTKTANPAGVRDFSYTVSGTGLTTVGQPGSTTFTLNPPTNATQALQVHPVENPPGGDTYTVTETIPADWVLRSLDCTVVTASGATSSISGDTATGSVDVPLEPGDTGSCVYDNEQLGSLTVVKQASPADGTQFPFTAKSTAGTSIDESFPLGNGARKAFTGLAAGTTVDITEAVPTNAPNRWSLVSITCTGNSVPTTRTPADSPTVGVTVAAGEDVTCTYSDAKVAPATVTVSKAASPADGTKFNFTVSGDQNGVLPADQSFGLSPSGAPDAKTFQVFPTVNGESYTVTESLTGQQAQDWQLTGVTCNRQGAAIATANPATFTLQPGDAVSCQYVNRKNARLTVLKAAPDDPAIQFPVNWGPNPLTGGPFPLADGGQRTQFPLLGGSYFVEELTTDPNFPKDWFLAGGHPVCTGTAIDQDNTRPSGANLQIGDGEDVSCTFTNFYDYRPGIQVVKSSNRDQVLSGGDVVYSYKMTNTGNIRLEPEGDIADVLVDDKCAPVTRTVGTGTILDIGDTWEFTCTSTGITQDVTNTATGTLRVPPTRVPVTGTDTHTVTVLTPSAELRKTADKPVVYAGDSVKYTYELENNGQTAFKIDGKTRDEWVTDDKCSPVKYDVGDTNDNQLLDIGETWIFTCSSVLQTTTTNTATTTPTPFVPQSPTTGPPQVGPPVPLTTTYTVTVPTPGVGLTKQASSPAGADRDGSLLVPQGSTVTFDYDVTTGNADTPMQFISLVDNKCSPVVYRSGDTNGDGLIDVDETWKYSCEQVFTGDIVITNVATVTLREPKGGKTVTTTADRRVRSYEAKIFVEKSPDRDVILKGDSVTYTFTVLNTGPTPISSINVVDDKCSPVTYRSGDANNDQRLDPTESWIYTCQSSLDVSTINRVNVTGTPPGGGTVTTTTTSRVQVRKPGIKVVKTGSAKQVRPGTKVTYDYVVTNTGTLALAEVKQRIRDDKCSPVKFLGGDKDGNGLLTNSRTGEYPDETWRFRCSTRIDRTTKNTVTTVGVPVNNGKRIGPPVRATDTWTVTVPGTTPVPPLNPPSGGGTPPSETPSRTGADIALALLIAMVLLSAGSTFYFLAREGRTRRK
jgi:hypothetical protein